MGSSGVPQISGVVAGGCSQTCSVPGFGIGTVFAAFMLLSPQRQLLLRGEQRSPWPQIDCIYRAALRSFFNRGLAPDGLHTQRAVLRASDQGLAAGAATLQ